MKKFVFAAVAALVMVSVSNVFANNQPDGVQSAAPADTVASTSTTTPESTTAPTEATAPTSTTAPESTTAPAGQPADTTSVAK